MNDDPLRYSHSVIPNANIPPDYNILVSAIGNCSGPVVQQLLDRNSSLINFKAWHGQTALHRACLGGNIGIVGLLLQAGAHPNQGNDFDETPLHYAAKRGIVPVVHLLMQHGGDVTVIDQNGRSMIHHAAETGCIYMIHYLSSVHGLSTLLLDNRRQLPLHLTAKFGQVDAFKYLLKKERSDLFHADVEGNTALHLTVIEGHAFMSWMLLETMGSKALKISNNDGYTPCNLASQRDRQGHKELVPILSYYEKHPTQHPRGPVLKWYWFLCLPGTVFAIATMASMLMGERNQGFVVFGGLFGIVFFMKDHMHRLTDVSRWPNPIQAGTFCAGIIHTTLYYLFFILPDMLDHTILMFVTPVYILVMLYLYITLLISDPGCVKHSDVDAKSLQPLTIVDLCQPGRQIDEFCMFCEIVRPPRTKHCRLCNTCYRDMDHHCLFLLKCIGGNNHARFIWFLIVTSSAMVIFIIVSGFHVFQKYNSLTIIEMGMTMFHGNAWFLCLIGLNAISIFWAINLILFQFSMIANGFTTYYRPVENIDILSLSEKFMNVVNFLIGRKAYSRNPFLGKKMNV